MKIIILSNPLQVPEWLKKQKQRVPEGRRRYNFDIFDIPGGHPGMWLQNEIARPPGLFMPFGPPVFADANPPIFGEPHRPIPAGGQLLFGNNHGYGMRQRENNPGDRVAAPFPVPPPAAHQREQRREGNWLHLQVNVDNNRANNQRVSAKKHFSIEKYFASYFLFSQETRTLSLRTAPLRTIAISVIAI